MEGSARVLPRLAYDCDTALPDGARRRLAGPEKQTAKRHHKSALEQHVRAVRNMPTFTELQVGPAWRCRRRHGQHMLAGAASGASALPL